jgi:hypothetical protein
MIDKFIAAFGAASDCWSRARETVAAHPGTTIVLATIAVVAAGCWL